MPQIHCKDVALDDHEVAKSIVEFAVQAARTDLPVKKKGRQRCEAIGHSVGLDSDRDDMENPSFTL
jgi:hypothetical protein